MFEKQIFSSSEILEKRNTSDIFVGYGGVFTGSSLLRRKGEIVIPEGILKAHVSVLGATRSGKSVLLKLIASQVIQKGWGLMLIDFKPDADLYQSVFYESLRAGREKDFIFFSPNLTQVRNAVENQPFPSSSATYNPLIYGSQEEIVSRILRSVSDFDKNTSSDRYWEDIKEDIIDATVGCLLATSKRFSYTDLWTVISNENAMLYVIENTKNYQARAKLYEIYRQLTSEVADRVRLQYKGTQVALARYAISEIAPYLNSYRPSIDLYDVLTMNKILHVALSQQLAEKTASGIAKLLLSDLNSVIGRILTEKGKLSKRFVVIIDEFASCVYRGIEDLFNKSAGAGVTLIIAHQSLADIDFKAGESMRNILLDNTQSKIYAFQTGESGPRFFSSICGKAFKRKGKYTEYSVFNPFIFFERNIRLEESQLVEPHYLTNIEALNFYAKIADQTFRGVIPIIPSPPRTDLEYQYRINKSELEDGLNLFKRFYVDSLAVFNDQLTPAKRQKIIKKKEEELTKSHQ